MSANIHVTRSPRNFTLVQNELLANPNLSFRAKGIVAYLIGKPDGWKLRVTDLQRHGAEGRDAIYAALKELREQGYAKFQKAIPNVQEAIWYVSDEPIFQNLEGEKPNPEKPDTGNPDTGNQDALVRKRDNKKENPFADAEEKPETSTPSSSEEKPRATRRTSPVKKTGWRAFIDSVIESWNERKRKNWPEIEKLTGREFKDLAEFWAHFDKDLDKAKSGFAGAVSWAATKERWTEGKILSLAELLANSKMIQYAQKASHVNSEGRGAASMGIRGLGVGQGDTASYQGSENVTILEVVGHNVIVQSHKSGEKFSAYADELGAPI